MIIWTARPDRCRHQLRRVRSSQRTVSQSSAVQPKCHSTLPGLRRHLCGVNQLLDAVAIRIVPPLDTEVQRLVDDRLLSISVQLLRAVRLEESQSSSPFVVSSCRIRQASVVEISVPAPSGDYRLHVDRLVDIYEHCIRSATRARG